MGDTNVNVSVHVNMGDAIRSLRKMKDDEEDDIDEFVPKQLKKKKQIYLKKLWEMSPS